MLFWASIGIGVQAGKDKTVSGTVTGTVNAQVIEGSGSTTSDHAGYRTVIYSLHTHSMGEEAGKV